MIHNDIQNQLQLLIKTSAPPLIEVADHAVGTPQWTPGQQLPAHVIASLPNGRFQVMVEDQMLDLNLPRNTQPGEQLQLTYISNTPRLTFALLRDMPQTPANPVGVPVSLSEAGKLVGNLLQQANSASRGPLAAPPQAGAPLAQQAGVTQAPLSRQLVAGPDPAEQRPEGQPTVTKGGAAQIASTAPLLQTAPTDVLQLARGLRTALSQSGLFYEAHQVQWLNGERTLQALRQEPQGQLTPLTSQASITSSPTPPSQQVTRAGELPLPQNSPQPIGIKPESSLKVDTSVHPQSVPLIQQQLHALDTRQVIWQGEVWPGQTMQWEIEEEARRSTNGGEGEAPSWHTQLHLELPTLGGVSAKLAFVEGRIQLDIASDAPETVALMRQQQRALADRFQTSGLALSGVTIQHG